VHIVEQEIVLDNSVYGMSDDDLLSGDCDMEMDPIIPAKNRATRDVDARRKIEQLMEQKRWRELDEDLF
jgi:hypothetical protein